MPQNVPEVQNTNIYRMVLSSTGQQDETTPEHYRGEKELKEVSYTHSPVSQAQDVPDHGHDG